MNDATIERTEEVHTEQQSLRELVAPFKSPPLVDQVKAFKQQSDIYLPSNLPQQFLLILEAVFQLIVKAWIPRSLSR
jgi:hypothetical protein